MSAARSFVKNSAGAMAAEFALVLPILLIFFFGIMDVGYYAWAINRGEKATQMGTRWAVATNMVPQNLLSYSFAVDGGVPQGTVVPQSAFPTVTCDSSGCTQWGYDGAAFNAIVSRIQDFKPDVTAANVQIEYSWSGLGYAGDPNGPDVAPIVTVRLINMQHRPLSAFLIGTVDLPEFAYSLTSEDSQGTVSN